MTPVLFTADLRDAGGELAFGRAALTRAGIERPTFLPQRHTILPTGALAGYDALVHFSGHQVTAASLQGAAHLRVIARLGVGTDMVDLEACTRAGVAVTLTPDAVTPAMASAAVAMALALAHRLSDKDRLVRDGEWDRRLEVVGPGLVGASLGIIGPGRIGRAVVAMTAGFGLSYLGYSPRLTDEQAEGAGVRRVDLATLLRGSDTVVVCCPRTPETVGLIGSAELGLMQPTARLVNIARGGIVDETALARALHAGRLAGAAVDVYADEPPDPDHPFLRAPRMLLAPHSAGYTTDMLEAMMDQALDSVRDVRAGVRPGHLANPQVWPPRHSLGSGESRSR